MFPKIKIVVAVLVALVAIGISSSSASAYVTSKVTVTETSHNEDHASTGTFIKFRILSYIKARGLTKKEVRHAEKCVMIGDGTNVPVYTNSGHSASGGLFKFEDTDREKACKVNGHWRLVRCGNFVWFRILPHIFHGHVLLVRTFAQKKIHIRIPLHVVVLSPCGGPPAEAALFVKQWVRLRAKVKAKGDVTIRISGKIVDRVKGHVRAGATCERTTTTITEVEPPPVCTTCGPPPPPPPVPNCYDEPELEKCKPTVEIETINDMEVSRDGHNHTRYICWDVYPGAESSLGSIETKLYIHYSEKLGGVEYRGGNEYCQLIKSSSETGTEEYHAWAKDTNTQAFGVSAYETFPLKEQTKF